MSVDACVLSDVDLLPYVCVASVLAFLCAVGIGANDLAANFAMVVGSGSLSMSSAIRYCAFFEMMGAAIMGGKVTGTITHGIVDDALVWRHAATTVAGMLSASFAATAWLFLSSYFGLPVSITHTVVGSMLGFAYFAGGGFRFVQASSIIKIVLSWVVAPVGAALATMAIVVGLRRVMLTRGEFLSHLRKSDAEERNRRGEAQYRRIGGASNTTTRSPRGRGNQRSFGGAAVAHLVRVMPLLTAATFGINGCFVLLEQPPPIQMIQPFELQVVVVVIVVAVSTYAVWAMWLPDVRRAAEDHRGPFPWQFGVLKIAKEKKDRSYVDLPKGRRSATGGSTSKPTPHRGHSPVAAPLAPGSAPVVHAGSMAGGQSFSNFHADEDLALPASRDASLGHSLGDGSLLSPSSSLKQTVAEHHHHHHVHYSEQEVVAATGALVPPPDLDIDGHRCESESMSSTSSSDRAPHHMAANVSFSLGGRAGSGIRVRRKIHGAPKAGSSSDDDTSDEAMPAGHDHQHHHHHRLDDARGAGVFARRASTRGTTLVPVKTPRANPTDPSYGAPSPYTKTAASPFDTSLRAEYLFTALQLIAGAMSSFVHGAVAGANATGPFIVLYSVFMSSMTASATAGGGAGGVHTAPPQYSTAFANLIAMCGIAVGMAVLGGRLVATVGSKLVVVTPIKGYAMQVGGTVVTMLCTAVGVPVSLSQCQVGAAVGSGLMESRYRAQVIAAAAAEGVPLPADFLKPRAPPVNWALVGKLVAGWVMTLLVSAATCGVVLHIMMHIMCGGHLHLW